MMIKTNFKLYNLINLLIIIILEIFKLIIKVMDILHHKKFKKQIKLLPKHNGKRLKK